MSKLIYSKKERRKESVVETSRVLFYIAAATTMIAGAQNNPALSQTQTQILGENIMGLGFLAHIVYGVVLGSMTTFLLRRRDSS